MANPRYYKCEVISYYLIPSSGSTTSLGSNGTSTPWTWCLTPRKPLFLRPEAPRPQVRMGRRPHRRGALSPTNPCSFVRKHHVPRSGWADAGTDVVLHSPQSLVPSFPLHQVFGLFRSFNPSDLVTIQKTWVFSTINLIGATRKTGGSNWGYKPPLLTRASRRGFSLCSSLSVIATLAAPKGAYLTNGSSYSFTLSLSTAISCFSWSLIYFLIVSSLRPTVLT